MSITPTLATAIAIAALAVPAAQAQPADTHASAAPAGAKPQPKQDLRSADTRDAARAAASGPFDGIEHLGGIHPSAAQAHKKQDLRSTDARDAANAPGATAVDSATDAREQDLRHLRAGGDIPARTLPGPPSWPADPQPITQTRAAKPAERGNGIDWTTIGLGIAGSLLAVSGLAALNSRRSRRLRRARVTA